MIYYLSQEALARVQKWVSKNTWGFIMTKETVITQWKGVGWDNLLYLMIPRGGVQNPLSEQWILISCRWPSRWIFGSLWLRGSLLFFLFPEVKVEGPMRKNPHFYLVKHIYLLQFVSWEPILVSKTQRLPPYCEPLFAEFESPVKTYIFN